METKKRHLDDLHFEHQLWLSEAKFYTDELGIYQKRLEEVASKNKVTVDTSMNFSYGKSTLGNMPEPAVVTVASGMQPNQISKPIKGSGGVYRIMVTKANPSTMGPAEELQTKTQLSQGFKEVRGLFEAVLNRFKIDANRINVF